MSGSILNIVIKIAAVLLAVLLWFNVISKKQYEYTLNLPVSGIDYPVDLAPLTPPPDSIRIKVQGQGRTLMRSDWKSAGLRLKAGHLHRGLNKLALTTDNVSLARSEDITLLDIEEPLNISVQLDRIDSVTKPIASRLAVNPAEGYVAIPGSTAINPDEVMVIGPQSLIRSLDTIYTTSKILDDADRNFALTLPLVVPSQSAIQLNHDSAVIEMKIDKLVTRKFNDIPVRLEAALERRGAVIEPDRVEVNVSGSQTLVDGLKPDQISVVVTRDAIGSSEDQYIHPTANLPDGIKLTNIKPDSLRIQLKP